MFADPHGEAMYISTAIALAAMVVAFLALSFLGKKFKQDIPVAVPLFFSMVVGSLAAGFGLSFRHLFEGPVFYIYFSLIFATGMIFLGCLKAAGNLDCMAYDIVTKFKGNRPILFCLLTLLLFFPGMFTGAGTAAVLSTGMMAIAILRLVGVPDLKVAGIVAMVTSVGAAAPPINMPALMIASSLNMPYDGFGLVLTVLTVPLGLFSIFWLGWKYYKVPSQDEIEKAVPHPPRDYALQPYVPLIVVVVIFALIRIFPGDFPDIMTPMVFMIGCGVAKFCGTKFKFVEVSVNSIRGGIFATIALLCVIGTVVQIITLTGVKGLLVIGALELTAASPLLIYPAMGISLPLLGGVLTHLGGAVVLGVPFTEALLAQNIVLVISGISVLCVLSQITPPSAVGGYFVQKLVGIKNYADILKVCVVPVLVCVALAWVFIYFANDLSTVLVPF
jgi:hypothetical protein